MKNILVKNDAENKNNPQKRKPKLQINIWKDTPIIRNQRKNKSKMRFCFTPIRFVKMKKS